jgi:hypothetical protein
MSGEVWRPIPGWPYEASSEGRIRRTAAGCSTRPGRILKAGACHRPNGYLQVRLSRGHRDRTRTFCVHQLVTLAFIGPIPNGWHTNHRDADKQNNRVENLEYVTPAENIRHAIDNGLWPHQRATG